MEWQERVRRVLARVLMAFVLCPAFAHAQTTNGCFSDSGSVVRLDLPPSVSFDLSRQVINGGWLYQSRVYQVKYRCLRNRPGTGQVGLQSLGDYSSIRQALRDAGLSLNIIINGDVINFWNPDPLLGGKKEYYFGAPYATDTGEQTFTLVLLLLIDHQVTGPLRVFLPSTTSFKLVSDISGVSEPGVFFTTSSTRFQYLPQCIGDLVVDNVVSFDTVLTDTLRPQLPQAKPFQVITRVNPACPDLGPLTRPSTTNLNDFFQLPLAVSFEPQGGERMDLFRRTIFLKNTDGKENGLKLSITNAVGNNVQFGPLFVDQLGMPISLSVNNIATELNNTTSVTQAYTAHLEREPTIGLLLGKYNASVLVKASWY